MDHLLKLSSSLSVGKGLSEERTALAGSGHVDESRRVFLLGSRYRALVSAAKHIAVVSWLLCGAPSLAQEGILEQSTGSSPVLDAEYNRLSDKLSRLVKRGHWEGADRVFRQIVALNRPLALPELLTCAEIERRAGNLQGTYDCLRGAAKLNGTREVIDWLVALEEQTGRVRIVLERGQRADLEAEGPVFLPEHQKAIDFAGQVLSDRRTFEGRLPVGRYTGSAQGFEVVAAQEAYVGPPVESGER